MAPAETFQALMLALGILLLLYALSSIRALLKPPLQDPTPVAMGKTPFKLL